MSVPLRMRRIDVGLGGTAGESGVYDDQLGSTLVAGLVDPGHGGRVVLRRVRSIDQDHVGVLEVNPVIGHGTPPKCCGQTGHRGGVSYACLVFDVHQAQGAGQLDGEVALLVVVGRAAQEGDRLGAVDGHTIGIRLLERLVAGLLDPLGDLGRWPSPTPLPRTCRCPVPGTSALSGGGRFGTGSAPRSTWGPGHPGC